MRTHTYTNTVSGNRVRAMTVLLDYNELNEYTMEKHKTHTHKHSERQPYGSHDCTA